MTEKECNGCEQTHEINGGLGVLQTIVTKLEKTVAVQVATANNNKIWYIGSSVAIAAMLLSGMIFIGWSVLGLSGSVENLAFVSAENKQEIKDHKVESKKDHDFFRNQNKHRAVDTQVLANKHNKTILEVNRLRRKIGGTVVLETINTTPFNPPEL